MLDIVFLPAQWVTRRLGFALKFVLVVALLLIPLALLTSEQLSRTSESEDFTRSELDGLTYVIPGTELLEAALAARTAVVEGATADTGPVVAALDGLTAAHTSAAFVGIGAQIGAVEEAAAAALDGAGTSVDQFAQWDAVASSARELIGAAADESGLVLDPQLTSYYLMDAGVLTLPSLRDEVGRLHDLLHLAETDEEVSVDLVLAETGTRAGDLAVRFDTAIDKVVGAGQVSGVERSDVAAQVVALVEAASAAAESSVSVDEAVLPNLEALTGTLERYETATLDALDDSLHDRLEADASDARSTLFKVGIAIALAMYVVGGVVLAVRRSSRPVVRSLTGLAQGRFEIPTVPNSRDELGVMASSVSTAIAQMSRDFTEIERCSRSLAEAALHVGSVSAQLAQSAESTTTQATVVAAGTEEMQASIREISANAAIAADVGGAAHRATIQANDHMHHLDERSRQISQMVDVIGEIAAQTNLLALNATIEAARAGAAGRGFAVVADEVKQLAGQTAQATETIVSMVGQIHEGTSSAGSSLAEIGTVIERVNESQCSISAAVEQQAMTTEEIAILVAGFLQSSTETATSASRLEQVASELTSTGGELRALVDRYEFAS